MLLARAASEPLPPARPGEPARLAPANLLWLLPLAAAAAVAPQPEEVLRLGELLR